MTPMTDFQPLTDAELDELADFLDATTVPEDGMSLEMLDGFLTALASGPEPVATEEWLPQLWHPEGGEVKWASPEQGARIVDLMERHLAGVAAALDSADDDYAPLLTEYDFDGTTVVFGQEWALGYLQGIALNAGGWQPLLDDPDYADDFAAIEALAEGPEDDSEAAAIQGQAQRDEQIGQMIGFALDARQFWSDQDAGPVH